MKLRSLFLSALLFSSVATGTEMTLPIVSVYDGDTINSEISSLPKPLNKISIRVRGIDTPELRGYKCPSEKALAQKARFRLIELLSGSNTMTVTDIKWDKYGGRVDGFVINQDGLSVGKVLIDEGLAYSYSGGAKRSWCK